MIYAKEIATPLGTMVACANGKGVCMLEFSDKPSLQEDLAALEKACQATITAGENDYLRQLTRELQEYFNRDRKEFSVPLELLGTPFQQNVWRALRTIPYGQTSTYGQLASRLNNPKSHRAVAAANGKNQIYILVPCHRVIGADGSLTGYGSGLWRKKFLLERESDSRSGTLF